jgi:anti-sigma B factor antagonist
MSTRKRAVSIHQLPEQVTAITERSFLRDLQQYAEAVRPRFVLDCSMVWNMDDAMINLLLSCLEEVMKCNGDVRLASLQPEAKLILQNAGVNRLFETYVTTQDAVQSFDQRPISLAPLSVESEGRDNVSENAA